MPHDNRSESISRIFKPFKDIFTTTPRQVHSVAVQEAGPISPSPFSGFETGLPTPDHTPSKRKASTSAPPSPTTIRPPSKRRFLKLPSQIISRGIARFARLPSPPAALSPPALFPGDTRTALDAADDYDCDGVLLQRSCQASRSAVSLASYRSGARAPARASSSSDERNASLVLTTIKEAKSETYRVQKGWHGGKYLVERRLPWTAYQLLLKKVEQEDKKLEQEKKDLGEVDENLGEEDENSVQNYEETLKGYFGQRLRFDYITRHREDEKQFTIHMPSHMHDGVAGALSEKIVGWYLGIREGKLCKDEGTLKATKNVAQKLRCKLATHVQVNDKTRQEPDLSFSYNRGKTAGLVVEVAWSQYFLKLPTRADRYIKGSKGKVRTVIGIDLRNVYDGGREAWFSVWQARFDEKDQQWTRVTTVDHQMFIGNDRKPVNGCALDLSLKDFICEEDVRKEESFEDVPLKITSEELHSFYEDSLQPHVCAEIDDEKQFISKDVEEDLAKIVEVERILQKSRKLTSEEQKATRSEELEKARDMLADAQKHIKKRRSNMKVLKTNLESASDGESQDVLEAKQKLAEAHNELAELEKKVAEKTSEVEGKTVPQSKKAGAEQKTRRASGRINVDEPSVPESSSGPRRSSDRVVNKSKGRL